MLPSNGKKTGTSGDPRGDPRGKGGISTEATAIRLTDGDLEDILGRLLEAKKDKQEVEQRINSYHALLKNHLAAIGADELTQAGYTISNKVVVSSVLDAKTLRAELPEIAARYTIEKEGRRFFVRAVV